MFTNIRIEGLASTVPDQYIINAENTLFSQDDIQKIIKSTGVKQRHITDSSTCTSDLCFFSAQNLLQKLKTDINDIDILIFITQTPDYLLPTTACILQKRLDLKNNIMAFDINLGCSGYTYGLILLMQLLSTRIYKKALLLVGDTISKIISKTDRSVAFLFGDAGSATLLSYDNQLKKMPFYYDMGTDGSAYDKLITTSSGFRDINIANGKLYMSGIDIFNFTLTKVPQSINNCIQKANILKENIDYFFFHQANLFMLNHLIKKLKLDPNKAPMSISKYGNTSSASIPITICDAFGNSPQSTLADKQMLLCGFGVGLSWATLITDWSSAIILPILSYPNSDNKIIKK